ncbi:hypothetical protein R3P38DRAFT_3175025 [Favolaschia claudopus]
MSRPEILRSGQYWQDVRRRAKEAKAAREAREAGEEESTPSLCDGAQVFTFAPGHSQPFVSIQHSGGRLLPISGPSTSRSLEMRRQAEKEAERQKKRCRLEAAQRQAKNRALQQKAIDADAALLARLRRGRSNVKKRALEGEGTARVVKKRVVEP